MCGQSRAAGCLQNLHRLEQSKLLQLCDFSRQGTAMPPILIPGYTGNANSAACGHVERRYESRFPQGIAQQALVVPLQVIHAATFLRGCYDWNSSN